MTLFRPYALAFLAALGAVFVAGFVFVAAISAVFPYRPGWPGALIGNILLACGGLWCMAGALVVFRATFTGLTGRSLKLWPLVAVLCGLVALAMGGTYFGIVTPGEASTIFTVVTFCTGYILVR